MKSNGQHISSFHLYHKSAVVYSRYSTRSCVCIRSLELAEYTEEQQCKYGQQSDCKKGLFMRLKRLSIFGNALLQMVPIVPYILMSPTTAIQLTSATTHIIHVFTSFENGRACYCMLPTSCVFF